MLDLPIEATEECSTDHDDWYSRTLAFLKQRDLSYIEINMIDGALIIPDNVPFGVTRLTTSGRQHVFIAEFVTQKNTGRQLRVLHDPSEKFDYGFTPNVRGSAVIVLVPISEPKGYWWCATHNRPADHFDPNGKRRCDPTLGGILMPCRLELRSLGALASPIRIVK